MPVTLFAHLAKVGSLFLLVWLTSGAAQVDNQQRLVDEGLLTENRTIEPGPERSHLRWHARYNNERLIELVELVHSLNEAGFWTDETYNRTLQAVEQGIIKVSSQILDQLVNQNRSIEYISEGLLIAVGESDLDEESPDAADLNDDFLEGLSDEFLDNLEELSEAHSLASIDTLHDELERLNDTGILSESVYEQLQHEIAAGNWSYKIQLYQTAAAQLKQEESVDPILVKPRLDRLRDADIISEQGYNSLLSALELSEIEQPIEFLNYIEQAQLFDLTEYSIDPDQYFPEIYQSVAQMLFERGLIREEINDFNLELIPNSEYERISSLLLSYSDESSVTEESINAWRIYDAVVSTQINNFNYEQSSFYSPPGRDDEDYLGIRIL